VAHADNSGAIANDASALERTCECAIDEPPRMGVSISPRKPKVVGPAAAVIEDVAHAQAQACAFMGSRRAAYCT